VYVHCQKLIDQATSTSHSCFNQTTFLGTRVSCTHNYWWHAEQTRWQPHAHLSHFEY